MTRDGTRLRRITWRPSRGLWTVLAATCAGSAFGLVFGLASRNRPVANALVFYVLGALVAAAVATVVVLLDRAARRRAGADGAGPGERRTEPPPEQ